MSVTVFTGIDESWRVGPEGAPLRGRRCQCAIPAEFTDSDGDTTCTKCGREPAIRLGAPVRAAESPSAAMNGDGPGDSLPISAPAPPAPTRASDSEPLTTVRRPNHGDPKDRRQIRPPASARKNAPARRRRRRRPRSNGSLSLVELGDLVEQFPEIDWSTAIEAAARDERRRVEGMWDALEDGSAVNEVAEGQATYGKWIEQLKAANPGIDNPEAVEEMGRILEGIAEVYGPQLAYEPVVIEQAFESIGGAERFAPDPDEERWMKVIPKQHERDAFSR